MKDSTIFWIFWLTFVSIHHNQLQYTNAIAVIKQQHQQLEQFQQIHKTAAISAATSSALLKKRQQQKSQQKQQQQQEKLLKGIATTTAKEVIGDVIVDSDDGDLKENTEKNVEKNILAKAINTKQRKNAIKTAAKTIITTTTSPKATSVAASSMKLFMQQLLKQHEETIHKFNDTGGVESGLTDDYDVDDNDDLDSLEILSKEIKNIVKMPIKTQNKNRNINNHQQQPEQNNLINDFKENLQNLLKSNVSNNLQHIKLQPEFNEEYVSSATSSTIKRAAIMLPTQKANTITTKTTTLPPSFYFVTPTSATKTTAAAASANTTTTTQQESRFNSHSTPVERRHIIPEKLQYTREIFIKQGRLMGIKRNFPPSSGLRAVDQYLGLPYAEAPVGSRRFMPPGKFCLLVAFTSTRNSGLVQKLFSVVTF